MFTLYRVERKAIRYSVNSNGIELEQVVQTRRRAGAIGRDRL